MSSEETDTMLHHAIGSFVLISTMVTCTGCEAPPSLRSRVAVTRANLRVLAESIEVFRTTVSSCPATGPGVVSLSQVLGETLVERGYVRAIPTDGWGQPIGFWSNGVHFMAASSGQNGRYDFDYGEFLKVRGDDGGRTLCNLASSPSNDDLVVVDGDACLGMIEVRQMAESHETSNYTLHPSSGVGLGADFVRTFARRG